jgi:hypothetical protein
VPTFDLLCLANSYKHGGHCFAGLRLDGGGWVRPVASATGAPLSHNQSLLRDGSSPQLFDLIRLGVSHHCPMPHHPENWLIDGTHWTLLRREAGWVHRRMLNRWAESGPTLLGDNRPEIPFCEFEGSPPRGSLQLTRPLDLHWRVDEYERKRRVRAVFRLGSTHYNLPFTDPDFHGVLMRRGVGEYSLNETGILEESEPLLTISLTEPFNGICYKLASALVMQPKWRTVSMFRFVVSGDFSTAGRIWSLVRG